MGSKAPPLNVFLTRGSGQEFSFGVSEEKGKKETDMKEDHLIFNIWIKDYLLLHPFLSD